MSDAVLDACLKQDPKSKVACGECVWGGGSSSQIQMSLCVCVCVNCSIKWVCLYVAHKQDGLVDHTAWIASCDHSSKSHECGLEL